MDLNLFKYFIAVYESKSIAKAAEKLVLTPSAVSMRVKELGLQLGVVLFVPHARGVHPTKEADELQILPAITLVTSQAKNLAKYTPETECVIRLGCATNIARYMLLDFIGDFRKKFPKTQISIHSEPINDLSNKLMKREIDILVYRLPIVCDEQLIKIERLCDLPKAFFANRDFMERHNICTLITQEQLAKLPVAVPDKTRDDAQFITADFIGISDLVGGNELVHAIAKKGLAIGYFNEHCVDPNDELLKITVKDLFLPMHSLGVAYHKNEASKPTLKFLTELKEFFNQ